MKHITNIPMTRFRSMHSDGSKVIATCSPPWCMAHQTVHVPLRVITAKCRDLKVEVFKRVISLALHTFPFQYLPQDTW